MMRTTTTTSTNIRSNLYQLVTPLIMWCSEVLLTSEWEDAVIATWQWKCEVSGVGTDPFVSSSECITCRPLAQQSKKKNQLLHENNPGIGWTRVTLRIVQTIRTGPSPSELWLRTTPLWHSTSCHRIHRAIEQECLKQKIFAWTRFSLILDCTIICSSYNLYLILCSIPMAVTVTV